uniref:Uncharacterized protein n=1 Tax=Monopterus albus TaxID=43700 RepID=A0A3Q3R511_MONAL|nr:uncharacterized protein LOC109955918 [Monopterus albus]XP_020448191.1 uncharacterized protein LOC109955918 [Monopterus albus]
MEEAYIELYQQFLRLRSLCLRQAALLHQLASTQKNQQGVPILNEELSDMVSIPVQCTQEIPVIFQEKPQPRTARADNSAAECGITHLSRNAGAHFDLLTDDMAKLSVDIPCQRKEDGMLEQMVSPLLTLDSSRLQGASSCESRPQGQTDHPGRDRTWHMMRIPATDSPSLSQSGGLLMSDVALQSDVCEFCQAIFPGDTTTRGEFLRHLYTHIT